MVVVFLVPVLAGIGFAKCAPLVVHPHRHADHRPVRGDSGGRGRGGHAAPRERVPGAARARHPDVHGPRLRDEHRHAAALHPAGAAAARGVDAGGHGLLRDAAVAHHAAASRRSGRARRSSPACRAARDLLHMAALWTTAFAVVIGVGAAFERWHFSGFSKSQEARKARFARWRVLDILAGAAAAVGGAAPPAGEGPEGIPPRRQPVVAAAPAGRADAGVSLQFPACWISIASRT